MKTSGLLFPMEEGFKLIFKCTRAGTILLMIPAQFGMGFGFVLPYGKLLQALGTTNLMPNFLKLNHCDDHTNGVIVGSIFGFLLSVLCDNYQGKHLPHICILAGFLTYMSQLHGYWMLKTKFSSSIREFHSPFGLSGVVFSSIVFMLGIIAIVGFSNNFVTVTFVGVYLLVLSIYYHVFAAKTQTIAQEEQTVLFQLHVVNHNRRKKHRHMPMTRQGTHQGRLNKVLPSLDSDNCAPSVRRVSENVADTNPTSVSAAGTFATTITKADLRLESYAEVDTPVLRAFSEDCATTLFEKQKGPEEMC